MAKDIIIGVCDCPQKQCTVKKYGGNMIIVCIHCDTTLAIVSKGHEYYTKLFNFVYGHTESEIRRFFGKNQKSLKLALEIKRGQEEQNYKRKLGERL